MDEETRTQRKKCFIITPIGDTDSVTFRKAKGVIDSVIKPVLSEYGFDDIKPAYEINESGMITTQIINRIIDDELVVANLTGNNPNVMYELCLRHVVRKPIIHICEHGTSLPFDIKDSRTIFYENDMLGVKELKDKLRLFIDEIAYDKEYIDNPIYTAYKYGKLLKETQGTEANEILGLLIEISNSVSELKRDKGSSGSNVKYNMFEKGGYDSIKDIVVEISDIDDARLNKCCDSIENQSYHKLRVHEMAKELNTSSELIITIANMLGINIRSRNSSLDKDIIERILKYIVDFKKNII